MYLPPGSMAAALTIVALVASPPTIAAISSITGAEMPWFGTTGVAGLLGFLLWWHIEKGDKRASKSLDNVAAAMTDVKHEVSGMRDDLKEGQDRTNELLEKALFPGTGGPK